MTTYSKLLVPLKLSSLKKALYRVTKPKDLAAAGTTADAGQLGAGTPRASVMQVCPSALWCCCSARQECCGGDLAPRSLPRRLPPAPFPGACGVVLAAGSAQPFASAGLLNARRLVPWLQFRGASLDTLEKTVEDIERQARAPLPRMPELPQVGGWWAPCVWGRRGSFAFLFSPRAATIDSHAGSLTPPCHHPATLALPGANGPRTAQQSR
jgi:hypothetical protein